MLAFISFLFVFCIAGQIETGTITTGQAIFYGGYGLLMFYHTSKPYWTENIEHEKNQKKGISKHDCKSKYR